MKGIKKMLLPMFLLAVSFCLISCGNKSNDENENNMPEITVETPEETTEVEENVTEQEEQQETEDATTETESETEGSEANETEATE